MVSPKVSSDTTNFTFNIYYHNLFFFNLRSVKIIPTLFKRKHSRCKSLRHKSKSLHHKSKDLIRIKENKKKWCSQIVLHTSVEIVYMFQKTEMDDYFDL